MTVDIAEVFLETLVQAAEQDFQRVNPRRNARVFINPVFRFLTYPVGVGDLARLIRTRRHGPRRDVAALNGLLITADTLRRDVPARLFERTVVLRMARMQRGNVNDEQA